MPSLRSPEPALARWLAHGCTSATHPVLLHALQTFLNPLGIEAESLEAEPFSALESGSGEWWLRRPRWTPARFDRRHPACSDFNGFLDHPEHFIVTVDDRGIIWPALKPGIEHGEVGRSFIEAGEQGWPAVRHTLRAAHAAETFLYAAAGLLLANDPAAETYARGDDGAFCATVHAHLRAIRDG